MKHSCVLFFLLSLAALCAHADNPYSVKYTVNGYAGAEELTNFPVLVRLSAGSPIGFAYDDCASGGADLAFTDEEGNAIPREIDTWNTAGESLVWVSVPVVTNGASFKMHYGDTSIAAQPACQTDGSVWSRAGYAGVWHLADGHDSLTNGLDGTLVSSITAAADSKLGGAFDFADAKMSVGKTPNGDLSNGFSLEAWCYPRRLTDKKGKNGNAVFGKNLAMSVRIEGTKIRLTTPGVKDHDLIDCAIVSNEWFHLGLTFLPNPATTGTGLISNQYKVYRDGVLKGTKSASRIPNLTDSAEMWIGGNQWSDQDFDGILDEFRLSYSIRSAAWVAASYATQHATDFLSAGPRLGGDAPSLGAPMVMPTCTNVQLSVRLLLVGEGATSAAVTFAYGPEGGALSEPVVLAAAATNGQTLSTNLTGLAAGAAYRYVFTATNNLPVPLSHTIEGTFSTFAYRATFTVAGYTGTEVLTNFPALVRLVADSPSAFSYADCAAGGADIRFTDAEGRLIPHEIESWNTAGESLVWVGLPIATNGTTFTMYCHSDTPGVSSTDDVWTNYVAVVHGGASIANAVAGGPVASVGSTNVSARADAGKVGGGINKSSSNSIGLNIADVASKLGNTGKYSVSAWFKRDGNGGNNKGTHVLGGSRPAWGSGTGYVWLQEQGNYISISAPNGSGGTHQFTSGNYTLPDGEWAHAAFAYDSGVALTTYFNGAQDNKKTSGLGNLVNTSGPWTFGSYANASSEDSFKGDMDELRIYNGVASGDRIKAEYDAMASASFLTTPFPPVTLTVPSTLPAHVTLVSVTTNGVEVSGVGGVYTVFSHDTVVATFAAEHGYHLVGDATVTVVMAGDMEIAIASIPEAEQNPEVVAPEVSPRATRVSPRKTVTLTASATGATSYRWLKNGEPIEGGTNGTLTVDWRMPMNNPIDTYQAVAVYLIDSSMEESEASVEMIVEYRPIGLTIVLSGVSTLPHDYSADYLTFRVRTSGTICWKAFKSLTKTIEYSVNNGAWTSITSTPEGETISVEKGDLVRFRGSNAVYATAKDTYSGFEGGTATYDIEGNIMSLLYGDNFADQTDLPSKSYIFCSLFKKAPVLSAARLVLPATTLQSYCYRALFSYCTTLTKAPELPATTLATGCYWYMFEHCAITEAPVLNATTLVAECYGHMFEGCGVLDRITCRATAGFTKSNCLVDWVKNVAGDGAFVKAADATSWTTGTSGIPTGWTVCEDILLLPPEVVFYGDTIELACDTAGAEIHYRLGQAGDFALYAAPISITADTVVETYSTCQGHTSETVTATCVYVQETPFQRSNKSLTTWQYGGNTITTPYSVNAINGHSSSYTNGTFAFDTSVTLHAAQPTYLWFQHADQSADIYVNGVKAGTHWGGYNAFFFDISSYVRRGQNKIHVALCNTTRNVLAPYAGDFNFNATLGNVKLFTSPVLPAMKYGYDGFHITSTVSDSSATINVKTTVPSGAELVCTITNNDGYVWTETKQSNGEEQTFTTTIEGSDLRLWNGKADPYLYNVTLEIYKDNELYHKYERPYGFRYYEYVINETVNGETYTGFLLNGRPYQLRGVCMHDDVEGKANALTDSDYDQEFAIIRELGCNFIRLAHYPHPKEVYDRCDQLGIIVQTEVPCVNKLQSTLPSDYYTHLEGQYTDMVQQHFNHPCIVFWGLSNETVKDDAAFGKEKIEGYYALIKDLDPERLVGYVMSHSCSDPSGYYNNPDVDWFGCNIYVGWYIDKTSNNPSSQLNTRLDKTLKKLSKPLAFSEYGCGGTQHCHSEDFKNTTTTGNYPRHDIEYQMWLHEGHIAAIRNYTNLLFTGQWQLFDIAVSSRNEGFTECIDGVTVTTNAELRYLNNKGLVERDHVTKKDTFYLYKAEWNPDPFVHICGKDYTKTTDRKLKCYTNDGDTLKMFVGDNLIETVAVTNHIAVFTATNFTSGVEIKVKGADTFDTVTFQ